MRFFLNIIILAVLITFITGCFGSSSGNDISIDEISYSPKALVAGEETEVQLDFSLSGGGIGRKCNLILPDSEIEDVQPSDEFSISITEETGIFLICEGDDKVASRRILLQTAEMPEISDFRAFPAVINEGTDNSIFLSWDIEHIYPQPACKINGEEAANSNGLYSHRFEGISSTTTFTVVCENEAGTASKSITVKDTSPALAGLPGSNVFTVGSDGGEFRWGNIKMEIPAGALDETVDITLKDGTQDADMTNLLVAPFTFEPEGLVFHQPVKVTVDYNALDFQDGGHTDFHQSHIQAGVISDGDFAKIATDSTEDNVSFETNRLEDIHLTSSPEPMQPFRADTVDIIKTDETVAFSNSIMEYMDDGRHDYSISIKYSMLRNADIIETGDVNRDGKDEIVAGYLSDGTLHIKTFAYENGLLVEISSFTVETTAFKTVIYDFDFVLYDVDNDAKDELIYIYTTRVTKQDKLVHRLFYHEYDSKMIIASYDTGAGWSDYSADEFSTVDFPGTYRMNIAAGNIDDDSDTEIVVFGADIDHYILSSSKTLGPEYYYTVNGFISILRLEADDEGKPMQVKYTENDHGYIRLKNHSGNFDLLVDNFDSDDADEVAFTVYKDDEMHIVVYDDFAAEKPFHLLGKSFMEPGKSAECATNTPEGKVGYKRSSGFSFPDDYIQSRTGDFNGDRIKEIVVPVITTAAFGVQPLVFSLNNSELDSRMKYFEDLTLPYTENEDEEVYHITYLRDAAFATGDIDSDGKDELYVLNIPEDEIYKTILHSDVLSDGNKSRYGFKSMKHKKFGVDSISGAVIGDFDGDSIKVHYTGEHEINILDPVVSVVVAAPPNWGDDTIQEELRLTETSYGTEVFSGSSDTHETGVTTKISIGIDAETPFWKLASLDVMAGWEYEMMHSDIVKEVTTYGTSYTTDAAHDYVVYTTPTYETFMYEVLSHENIDDIAVAEDGKRYMMINIPMTSNTYKWEFDAFQETSDNLLDGDIFSHEIGNPFSYPDYDEKNAIIQASSNVCRNESDDTGDEEVPCGFQSQNYMQVGNGFSYTTTSLKYEDENMTENKTADTFSVEAKACVKMYCLGLEGAYTNASIYEVSAGRAMEFEGSVADVVPEHYLDYHYGYKLFTYFYENSNGQKFLVIDYSVE